MAVSPFDAYSRRLAERRHALRRAETRDSSVANLRLLVALVGLGVGVAAFGYHQLSALWLWPCAVAFGVLVVLHMPVIAAKRRASRAVTFYEHGLKRLAGEWQGLGRTGGEYLDRHHPYAADFDVFGPSSLFQRLAVLQTRTGEDTLAKWLLLPPSASVGRQRQQAVAELAPQLDARELLAVDAEQSQVRAAAATDSFASQLGVNLGQRKQVAAPTLGLAAWGQAPRIDLGGPVVVALLYALASASGASLVAWLGFDQPWKPFVALLIVVSLVTRALKSRADQVTRALVEPLNELKALVPVLRMIEQAQFQSPQLLEIQSRVRGQTLASVAIARLARRVDWFESRRNQLFAPLAYVLLWEPLFAHVFESWRRAHGQALAGWLSAAGEVEALHALGAYAYENPDDVFAEVVDAPGVFDALELGHPLLRKAVRNDVRLPRVLLVSGSNMSGKSTLLRAIGANALLGLIGAPVRAKSLRMSWCTLGATLRVEDSLQDGASRFFAEVQRLKQLVDLASEQPPLLFLLDEIMGGTNSHDRRVGTEALIAVLLKKGAFGVVTTHDLALTDIAQAENVHFEDQMVDARLAFDYRMRPGVVTKSNALALMRAAGLELETDK